MWCMALNGARHRSIHNALIICIKIPTNKMLACICIMGDMTDATNLIRLIQKTQPDEIYNLAAQSHVQVSFETPEYTANADALGALRILEGINCLALAKKLNSIRRRHPNFTEKWLKRRKTNKRPLFRDHPTQPPSYTPIGRR